LIEAADYSGAAQPADHGVGWAAQVAPGFAVQAALISFVPKKKM
jgi:hypothetical protein